MRIGILVGSFNPVHNEHVAIAKYVKDELRLDKILNFAKWSASTQKYLSDKL